MTFSIQNHRLLQDGSQVDFIKSPFTGQGFGATPKIVVIHFTYGGSARSSAEWFRNPSNPGSSAHVVIDRDGTVFQCVDFGRVAWHAGRSRLRDLVGLNAFSFGIELANWGYLKRSGTGWACHTGLRISEPFFATHKNGNPNSVQEAIGWETYPEPQFLAAAGIARSLVEEYGVSEIVGHDDISPGRKWDPGPAFDMMRFRARVFGERADMGDTRMRVVPEDGLNLRSGPGTQFAIIQLLPVGTLVEPIEQQGRWLSVTVIGPNGQPQKTGWVHTAYLADA